MKEVNACIITIGDELLIGQTIDTNSAFIAQELNKIGIWVKRRIAIGDVKEEILNALKEQSKDCQVIIMTGGLGPTADDITKPTLCEYFNSKIIIDEGALQNVKDIFTKLNRPLIARNLKQAEVPDNCIVLPNLRGTAPGMWFAPSNSPNGGESGPYPNLPPTGEGTANTQPLLKGDADKWVGEFYQEADPLKYGLLKNFVSEHRKHQTPAEEFLWQQLKGNKLSGYAFRRQHIIGSFIVDFVCLAKKLIIEVDGLIHQLPENKMSDEERTMWLQQKGYEVIRFTNEEILFDTKDALNKIEQTLEQLPFAERKAYSFSPVKNSTNNEVTSKSGASATGPSPVRGSRMGALPIYISLPGVPNEMKGLMEHSVIPKLKETLELPAVIHRTLLTSGIGESTIADTIEEFENNLPPHIKLAYLPAYGLVRLRLTGRGSNKEVLEKEVDEQFEKLKPLVKEWMVAEKDISLEESVSQLLKSRNKTITTAESCTGGYIAHLITSKAGSSAIYKGSVVSYANEVKQTILGVKPETLQQYGAVSEQTVTEMVQGILKTISADYAIATSGIMGPDGGSAEKPVGTVWIAVGNNEKIKAAKYFFRYDRTRNIEMTAQTALTLLRKFILEEHESTD
jgi:PncC family amidohydrolase